MSSGPTLSIHDRYALYAINHDGDWQYMYALPTASQAKARMEGLAATGLRTAVMIKDDGDHPTIAPKGAALYRLDGTIEGQ